jgi:hypothetical protein
VTGGTGEFIKLFHINLIPTAKQAVWSVFHTVHETGTGWLHGLVDHFLQLRLGNNVHHIAALDCLCLEPIHTGNTACA